MDMSSVLEEDLGFIHRKISRGKDKGEKFLKQREFYLDVKKQNTHMFAHQDTRQVQETYTTVSNDIWYQVSRYVEPQDVQIFAMICKATSDLVRTKSFWKNLFKKYCLKSGTQIWILQLPAHLQLDNIWDYTPKIFRTCVIEALFYCYAPLVSRLSSYTLDLLIGKDYISAWHKQWENCMWIMCYQFRQRGHSQRNNMTASGNVEFPTTELVNDWESLVAYDDNDNVMYSRDYDIESTCEEENNPYEGICLLVIFGNRFIPFPRQLTYSHAEQTSCLRLLATRRPLTSDMREYNLELDFVDSINKTTTTVRYPTVKHKVLPWWHPDFKTYVKYDNCDKFS